MSSQRSCWEIYNKQMSQLNHGDALWDPAPLDEFKRIQTGDVGYIRRGCFHLLFSAGCPLGERQLGIDVPRTFKKLDVGPISNTQPRLPGYLSTSTVRKTRTPLRVSIVADPILEPCSTISFQLTGDRGATLLTKHMTYREDIRREWTFEEYTKAHYDSWVAFARDNGYGNAIKPVLVTGVDMTRDFAMMSYANDDDSDLTAEFTTSAPGASAWGTWQTTGVIYTNCGPQLCRPRPPAQAMDSASSGNHRTETVSDEYNQCVFVRYFTVRKRLGIPRVIKAAAGPHDLGPGGSHGGGSPPEVQYSSDSSSDIVSSPPDDDGDDDRSSITSVGSESDVVVHNTTPDERDDFDVIADYVFQNSDADFALIHHRDIALLREPGCSTDLSTQLIEKRPLITVDGNGAGTIGRKADPPANTRSDGPLGTTPPPPLLIHGEIEHGTTSKAALPEARPPSRRGHAPQNVPGRIQEATTGSGGSGFGPSRSVPPMWCTDPYRRFACTSSSLLSVNTAKPIGPPGPGFIQCDAGMFAGRTIRAEVNEVQKANVGKKYSASKDRRALDPPPVAELRICDLRDAGDGIIKETEVEYKGLQPIGLICHVEVFQVQMAVEENPAQVTDLPEPPSANSSCPQLTRNGEPIEGYWRNQPITAAANHTNSLVGDLFTQALNLPIGPNGKPSLVFVFSDLSVQLEGWFLLRYRVFDLFSVSAGQQPILAECWGRPFRVYMIKEFPGLETSTELTRVVNLLLLHSHHVPVRAREVRRKRKKNPDSDSSAESDQDQSISPGPSPSVAGTAILVNRPSKRPALNTTERQGLAQTGR